MQLADKARVIQQVEPIVELLHEIRGELDSLPRSAVATRQLSVIICKLVAWRETYEPKTGQDKEEELSAAPSHDEIDRTLKAYRRGGYHNLTDRQKVVLEFYDRHYVKAA